MGAPSSFMLSVLSGTTCIGFVLARGKAGHEAFTANERSLGTFSTQREAADAVDQCSEELHRDRSCRACIVMPAPCPRCNGTAATIGAGRGPHCASLMCVCGRHLGWMSRQSHGFITATVRQFGRPTEPIRICASAQTTAPLGADAVSQPMHPDLL